MIIFFKIKPNHEQNIVFTNFILFYLQLFITHAKFYKTVSSNIILESPIEKTVAGSKFRA